MKRINYIAINDTHRMYRSNSYQWTLQRYTHTNSEGEDIYTTLGYYGTVAGVATKMVNMLPTEECTDVKDLLLMYEELNSILVDYLSDVIEGEDYE